MDVIRHQAPSQNADVVPEGVLAKQLKIAYAVPIGEENVLPVVPSLGDVMRRSWKNESRSTGHAG
jgi:hypothetical protein